jgi:hypothetical protein
LHKPRRAVQADGPVSHRQESLQVTARSTPEIQDIEGRLAVDVTQQGGDVLADVVVLRAGLELIGVLFVRGERKGRNLGEVFGIQVHGAIVHQTAQAGETERTFQEIGRALMKSISALSGEGTSRRPE